MIIGLEASRANISERTGTERYAFEVIQRLLPMLSDHQVRLYVREPLLPDWLSLPPYVEVRVLKWPPGVLWTHLRLSWELLWHQPDVLFVPADTVPLIHPKKTISTIHDIAFERFPELYRGASVQRRLGWLRPFIHLLVRGITLGRYSASERDYHRWSVRQAVHSCSQILTVSEFSKQEIIDLLHVNPSRITVTRLGIDQPEQYSAITPEQQKIILQKLELPPHFFLFIGRLEKKKNIAMLIRAYQRYVSVTTNPIDLALVGSPGFGWEEALPIVHSPDIQSKIHILGWQPDEVVDVLRVSATALLFISQYEGFGLPALDAMSAGLPVIASRHGSLPETIGPAGIFVDAENIESIVGGMRRVVEDLDLRTSLIKAGRERVSNFTWEETTKKTLEVLLR